MPKKIEANPNRSLLDYAAKLHWFNAKKQARVLARKATSVEIVESLEGPVKATKGDYVCRGIQGELWVQSEENLNRRYNRSDKTDGDWQVFLPKDEGSIVAAVQLDKEFQVKTKWGTLTGKPGDYLLRSAEEERSENPSELWIVAETLFDVTYRRVES